jgi:hypothetical protein
MGPQTSASGLRGPEASPKPPRAPAQKVLLRFLSAEAGSARALAARPPPRNREAYWEMLETGLGSIRRLFDRQF